MATPRTVKLAWFAIPALFGAGTLSWVLASGADREPEKASADSAPAGAKDGQRMTEAARLSGERGSGGVARRAKAYADWASDPANLQARKLLLASLFNEPDLAMKLSGVLEAVEADPTPAEHDPLWDYLTRSLAELWKGDAATKGMDLVLAESRPRALRALISSFAHVATSDQLKEYTPEQRQVLTETMIDVALHVPATQKPEVDRALRGLGGNDLADIMAGKGITGRDGHVLESERAYEASLEQTRRELAEGSQEKPGR